MNPLLVVMPGMIVWFGLYTWFLNRSKPYSVDRALVVMFAFSYVLPLTAVTVWELTHNNWAVLAADVVAFAVIGRFSRRILNWIRGAGPATQPPDADIAPSDQA